MEKTQRSRLPTVSAFVPINRLLMNVNLTAHVLKVHAHDLDVREGPTKSRGWDSASV